MTIPLRLSHFIVLAGFFVPTMAGCANRAGDCEASARCAESAGAESGGKRAANGGTASGKSSAETPAGGPAAGGTSTRANNGSETTSGSAGAGGTLAFATGLGPCDGPCPDATPRCDVAAHRCVACLADGDCLVAGRSVCSAAGSCVECNTSVQCVRDPSRRVCATNHCVECATSADCIDDAQRSVCDPSTNECVGCLQDGDCRGAEARRCQADTQLCVACLSNGDCSTPAASLCELEKNVCVPCTTDTDCRHIPGKGVCDAGTCVECTGKKNQACGASGGIALVCDSLAKTCSKEKRVQSSGLCQSCISDLQCRSGQFCLAQSYKGQALGYFCFWKQGDTANGAPVDCTLESNRPYVNLQTNAVSIDGETANACTLRSISTCLAIHQYSAVDCAPNGTREPQLCGVAPGEDALCVPFGATQFRCTNACLSADDCVGSGTGSTITCDSGTSPRVCTLN
jgi:hypothetical protein